MDICENETDQVPSLPTTVYRGRQNLPPVPLFMETSKPKEPDRRNRLGTRATLMKHSQLPRLGNFTSQLSAAQPEDLRSHLQPRTHGPANSPLIMPDPSSFNAVVEPSPVQRTMSLPVSISTTSLPINGSGFFGYRRLGILEIRLLKLHPGTSSEIECEIIHSFLHDHPTYIALSYAWGDPDDTDIIKLDGHDMTITSSLYGALSAVRNPTESIYVWADALCINQHDKEELSEQVKLMTRIYEGAVSVSIWLGHGSDQTSLAVILLECVTSYADSVHEIRRLIASDHWRLHFAALVTLFESEYWRRLWVVQEVLSAKAIAVYVGDHVIAWEAFIIAIKAFKRHRGDLENFFPSGIIDDSGTGNDPEDSPLRPSLSVSQILCTQGAARPLLSVSSILCTQGPANFQVLDFSRNMGPESLLEVLHACRTKLAANPRDKVFGILGILTEEVRAIFPIDYRTSVKEVYTNVVHYLIQTTKRLDVICEAIHFPLHTGLHGLPSWVPDWSQVTQIGALKLSYDFSAAGDTVADACFPDSPRRTRLQIKAIELDSVYARGITVGTLGTLEDLLMAFLHWRAKLLATKFPPRSSSNNHDDDHDDEQGSQESTPGEYPPGYTGDDELHETFCRTLCLGQKNNLRWRTQREWKDVCYHVFASLIRERLPHLVLDEQLQYHADQAPPGIRPEDRRRIIQENCKPRMMGRCFFVTRKRGLMGLGSGALNPDDEVCIPLGCGAPVLLRPEGPRHRYVGDAYVDGYMTGRAVMEWRRGALGKKTYVVH